MKKFIRVLLVFAVAFINVQLATAMTLNEGYPVTITKNGSEEVSGFSIWKYDFTITKDGETKSGAAYCLDANRDGPGNDPAIASGYKIKRILGVTSSTSEGGNSYDHGMLKILEDGIGSNYLDTSFAVRTFTNMYGYGRSGQAHPQTSSAYVNLAIKYISNNYDNVKQLGINVGNCGSSWSSVTECLKYHYDYTYSGYKDWYLRDSSFGDSVNYGSSLFSSGVTEAVKWKNGTPDGVAAESSVTNERRTEETETGIRVIYTFTFNNYPSDGSKSITNMKLNYTSNPSFEVGELQYYSSEGWKPLPSDTTTNLYSLISSPTGTVDTLNIGFEVTFLETEECTPLDYTITYDELGAANDFIGAIAEMSNYQRFALIIQNDSGGDDSVSNQSINDTIECGEPVNADCKTTISIPACTKTDNVSEIKAPEDIKNCIIDKEDDVGNSYQSTQFPESSNSFCKIFCKEDYAKIKLEGPLDDGTDDGVKCLGYFQLNARVEGSKDCYEVLDYDAYTQAIEQAQKDMIDSFNTYNQAKAKYEKIDSMRSTEKYYCVYNADNVLIGCDKEISYNGGGTYYWNRIKLVASTDGNYSTANDTRGSNSVPESYSDYCRCRDSECSYGEYATYGTYINSTIIDTICDNSGTEDYNDALRSAESERDRAKRAVDGSEVSSIESNINSYNGCASAFKDVDSSLFKFAQKINWDYAEGRNVDGNVEFAKPYTSGIIGDELKVLTIKEGTLNEGTPNKQFCTGDVTDDRYENCSTTWGGYPSLVNKTYIVCKLNSSGNPTCAPDNSFQVSPVKHAKIRFEKSADYETPSVYYQSYPTAKIGNSNMADNSDYQFVELKHKLPTSSLLVGGGWYSLNITDLGEYYDDTDSGRLLGGSGSKPSIGGSTEAIWGGEYMCNFVSPCQPEDCPECKFTCSAPNNCRFDDVECPECKFKCSENGCLINFGAVSASTKTISTTALAAQANCGSSCASTSGGGGSASDFRNFGYNWNINTSIAKFELVKAKAEKTIHDIDEKNTKIYDEEVVQEGTSESSLVFSVKLTPSMAEKIRDYNENQTAKGGYGNDTLICYNYITGSDTYEHVFCYSRVIDDWMSSSEYSANIVAVNRSNDERDNSTYDLQLGAYGDSYWSPWTGDYKDDAKDDTKIGGPSWK